MANIGTFTAEKDGFTGTLRTLTLNVKVKLVPNDKGDNENAPDFRLQAAGHDIGAAWKKTSEAGRRVRVRDPRRSFVPGDGLCPPDRKRGRHARPDLVAQQAQGGLTSHPPRPADCGGARCSLRQHVTHARELAFRRGHQHRRHGSAAHRDLEDDRPAWACRSPRRPSPMSGCARCPRQVGQHSCAIPRSIAPQRTHRRAGMARASSASSSVVATAGRPAFG